MTNEDGQSSATSPKASPKSSSGDKKSETSPKPRNTAKQTKMLSEQYAENAATPEAEELRKLCNKLSLTEQEVRAWFTRKRATDSKAKDEKSKKKPKIAADSNPKVATVPDSRKAFTPKPCAANLAAAAKAVEDLFGPFYFPITCLAGSWCDLDGDAAGSKGILAKEGSPGTGDVATLKRKYDDLYGKFGVVASEMSVMQKQLNSMTKAVAELKKK